MTELAVAFCTFAATWEQKYTCDGEVGYRDKEMVVWFYTDSIGLRGKHLMQYSGKRGELRSEVAH